ncbi:beta-1 3-galactosyltransferase 5 [Biomphalaria pfeifferi]|uniref:Hexosyltransferase n=1 Tax=Biomphalaria pfeifferi TaxID=112525 RepID=A0AAD8FJM6_BIOPF|nr:beta-1 3-galactosyltransferase 5 [Biomphalaria pfeifferi]
MSQVLKKRKTILLLGLAIACVLMNIYFYTFKSKSKVGSIIGNIYDFKQTILPDYKYNGKITSATIINIVTGLNVTLRESYTTQLYFKLRNASRVEAKDTLNQYNFVYKIVPIVDCSNSELVICVDGSRSNNHTRQTIRKTWGSYANVSSNKAALIFFLGSEHTSTNGSQSVQNYIDKEADLYGDILQEDYIDHYKNLTFKTLSILKWVTSRCPGSQFVLKADDDMFINVPLLVQNLNNISQTKGKDYPFVFGFVINNIIPHRNPSSKWYTSEIEYKENTYPRFTSGTAYAMTTSAAKRLYTASFQVPFFWLEDVYVTGLCARKANVEIIHSNLFTNEKRNPTGCTFKSTISGHWYTDTEMERIHTELFSPTSKCL